MRAGLRTGIALWSCLWFGCPADSTLNGGDPVDMPNQDPLDMSTQQDLSSGADLSAPVISSGARSFGNAADQVPTGLVTDRNGNVVVVGNFAGTVDFGGGVLTSAGGNDIFVAKRDSNGGPVWSKRFGDAANQDGNSNVLLAGSFSASVDFGGGSLTSAGDVDMILAKFTPTGTHVWSSRYGSTLLDEAIGIGATASGNVLATGTFQGSEDFDGVPLVSAGGQDLVILRHTP